MQAAFDERLNLKIEVTMPLMTVKSRFYFDQIKLVRLSLDSIFQRHEEKLVSFEMIFSVFVLSIIVSLC